MYRTVGASTARLVVDDGVVVWSVWLRQGSKIDGYVGERVCASEPDDYAFGPRWVGEGEEAAGVGE